MKKKRISFILILPLLFILSAVGYAFYHYVVLASRWSDGVAQFLTSPQTHQDWIQEPKVQCSSAPFLFPTRGYIGFLWDISFKPFHRHQGVDIFGGEQPGITPVYSVSDGYITRKPDWKSSLILRIPKDPLNPQQQIWVYFTHLAMPDGTSTISNDFPPGTGEQFIRAGTLLGYQGNYSGTPGNPTGVHLHLSIVKDNGSGQFLNELQIKNTIDPSPYLGLSLNAASFPEYPIKCK